MIIFALFLLSWEIFILLLYLSHKIALLPLLGLHIFAMSLCLLPIGRYKAQKKDLSKPLLLFLSSYAGGPFGILGFLIFCCMKPVFSLLATPASIWFEGLFPTEKQSIFSSAIERIESKWDDYEQILEVSSFEDLFSHGNLMQKQAILDVIVKDFDPSYANILQQALRDDHNVVRIQAASIVAKIDDGFEKQWQDLIKKREKNPDDAIALLDLANHCYAYAMMGLIDEIRKKEIAHSSIDFYRQYLKKEPHNLHAIYAIGELLFHENEYEDYIHWIEEYRKTKALLPEIFHTWYLEALYRCGQYEQIANQIRRL